MAPRQLRSAGRPQPVPLRRKHPRAHRAGAASVAYNGEYAGENLNRVAFPLGGIGAGMICLEGTGALSHVSLRNKPEVFNEPCVFAAICVKGKRNAARVLEGPVPAWKLFGAPGTGNGAGGTTYGLPRFARRPSRPASRSASVTLDGPASSAAVEITGWSPFEPGDADNSSLPVAALEYRFTNRSTSPVEAVFSFNAKNFMAVGRQSAGGAAGRRRLHPLGRRRRRSKPWEEGAFSATVAEPGGR